MKDWFYTLRWKNLLIIWISIFAIILPHFQSNLWNIYIEFILWGILCTAIAAIGNITNDLWDVKQDKENHKRNIFFDPTKNRIAWVIISILLILGVLALASSVNIGFFSILASAALVLLILYNLFLKKIAFLGNVIIAFLTLLIFAGMDLIVSSKIAYFNVGFENKEIELLACFAFITTLIREILKDAEDRKGDSFAGFKTLAMYLSDKWIGVIILLLTTAGITGTYFIMMGRQTNFFFSFSLYAIWTFLITLLSFIAMLVPNPSKYVRATRIIKAGMLGCLGIYLFLSL